MLVGYPPASRWAISLVLCSALSSCSDDTLRRLGDTCAGDGECASGRCDELVCKASNPRGEGESCSHSLECLSEACLIVAGIGTCTAGTREHGQACTVDAQCASGRCISATCEAAGVDAGPGDGATADAGPADGGAVDAGVDAAGADLGASGTHIWSKAIGGTSIDWGIRVAVDPGGNVVLIGQFRDTVDFGGGPITAGGQQVNDFVVARYDASGAHLWSKRFGDTGTARGVAADVNGGVYVVGSFNDTLDLGGGVMTAVEYSDLFLVALDASGAYRWSKYGGATGTDGLMDVAVDGEGAVAVGGYFSSSVDLGGGALTSAGGTDILLARFDGEGQHLWSKRFGSDNGNVESGESIAVDPDGNIALAGYFHGSMSLGGPPLATVDLNAADFFVARFDKNGDHIWSRAVGCSNDWNFWIHVATDTGGNVAVAGDLSCELDFGGGPMVGRQDSQDAFLVRYAPDGTHLWSKQFGSIGSDVAEDVVVDSAGNIYITGWFSGTADFGGGFLTSAGYGDTFVASYDASGAHRWSRAYGSAEAEGGMGLAFGADVLAVTGNFGYTVDFGGGPLISAGLDDIYLLVLRP